LKPFSARFGLIVDGHYKSDTASVLQQAADRDAVDEVFLEPFRIAESRAVTVRNSFMHHYLWELGARVRSICADLKQLNALLINACFLVLDAVLKVYAELGRDLKAFHCHVFWSMEDSLQLKKR
jgi:hypothetical protein